MLTIFFLLSTMSYGVGYEGYENNKFYFGVYTPDTEYGYVITDKEIYLDTVFEKH